MKDMGQYRWNDGAVGHPNPDRPFNANDTGNERFDIHFPMTHGDGNKVDHPAHYGGKDNPHETIKCIEAWGLGYALGNAVKYISRAGKKTEDPYEDLLKAKWYIEHELERLQPS